MKFLALATASALFALTSALEPLPSGMTVEQASAKCGDKAQLSCCNDATYTGDSTSVDQGVASGLLSNVLGGTNGAEGLPLFDNCAKLDVSVLIGVQDLLNQNCKQNVACCQQSGTSADGDLIGAALPCIGIGSVL